MIEASDLPLDTTPLEIIPARGRMLTAAEFQGLADVPPEAEWFANIQNPRTRRAYEGDIKEFMAFVGIHGAGEFRQVTRAHAIAWRKEMEHRDLSGATIRRKLSALASLFDHLCESNSVPFNPLRGVKRPKVESNEGKTPAIGDGQARALLDAPPPETLKGKRDRAILAVLLLPRTAARGIVRPPVYGTCKSEVESNICGYTVRATKSASFRRIPRP